MTTEAATAAILVLFATLRSVTLTTAGGHTVVLRDGDGCIYLTSADGPHLGRIYPETFNASGRVFGHGWTAPFAGINVARDAASQGEALASLVNLWDSYLACEEAA